MTRGTRTFLAAVAVAGLMAAAACDTADGDDQQGQRVEFVAGGGGADSGADGGKAPGARIDGRLKDLAVDPAGTVRVLTGAENGQLLLWTVKGGTLSHVTVKGLAEGSVTQLAAGPGGSVYLASWLPPAGVWQVAADGAATRVVGGAVGGAVAGSAPSPDGTPAAQASTGSVGGVAVSPSGQLYFAEHWTAPADFTLVRTVENGKLRTVLGRDLTGLHEPDWAAARSSTGFPAGTAATNVALVSPRPVRLGLGKDGQVQVITGYYRVVYADRKGTAVALIGAGSGKLKAASTPFAARGTVADAKIVAQSEESDSSIASDPRNGDVYLVNWLDTAADPQAFTWSGDLTDRQRALVESRKVRARSSTQATEVLRVDSRGTVSTAAYNADSVAVHGQWLYLASNARDKGKVSGVIVVRTAIPQ